MIQLSLRGNAKASRTLALAQDERESLCFVWIQRIGTIISCTLRRLWGAEKEIILREAAWERGSFNVELNIWQLYEIEAPTEFGRFPNAS